MSRPPLSARLRSMRAAHVLLVAVAVVAVDMLSKGLAERHLAAARELAFGASLQLGHNDGVAFGFLGGEVPNIAVIALGALITAAVAAIALRTSLISSAAVAGVLLGGAVANLIDRTPDGRVTDFIALPHWPTFNVADIAITLGVMAVLVTASRRPDQLKPTPPTPGAVTETS